MVALFYSAPSSTLSRNIIKFTKHLQDFRMDLLFADRAALLLDADKMALSFDFEASLEPEDHLDGLQAKARQYVK